MPYNEYSKLKALAEQVIKHLLLDAEIVGVKFDWPTILIDRREATKMLKGQVYLMCESKFKVFEEPPTVYSNVEEEMANISKDDEIKIIASLRHDKIVDVFLGETEPHLIIFFESGKTLFLNGHHSKFEPWELGVWFPDKDEDF
jgi:hypothetical protein